MTVMMQFTLITRFWSD